MQWFLHCRLLSKKLYCNSVCCYCMFSGKITIGKITLLLSGKINYTIGIVCFQERLLQCLL